MFLCSVTFLMRRYYLRDGGSLCFAVKLLSGANISNLVAELLPGGYTNEVRMIKKLNSTGRLYNMVLISCEGWGKLSLSGAHYYHRLFVTSIAEPEQ
jgi:hypothetical protein